MRRCLVSARDMQTNTHIRGALVALLVALTTMLSVCISLPEAHASEGTARAYIHVVNQFGKPASWVNLRVRDRFGPGQNSDAQLGQDAAISELWSIGSTMTYEATGGFLPITQSDSSPYCTAEALAAWTPASVSGVVSADESKNHFTLQLNPMVRELTEPGISSQEQRMLDLINAERARLGVGPVRIFERASAASDAHATALAVTPGLGAHKGPACADFKAYYSELGGSLTDRSDSLEQAVTYSERCNAGYDADKAFAKFMGSPAHRSALMNPNAQGAGIARVDDAWVVDYIGTGYGSSGNYATENIAYTPNLASLKRVSPNKWCNNTSGGEDTSPGSDEETIQKLTVQKVKKAVRRGGKVTLKGSAQAGNTIVIRVKGTIARTTARTGNTWSKTFKLSKKIKGKKLQLTVSDGQDTVKATLRLKRR